MHFVIVFERVGVLKLWGARGSVNIFFDKQTKFFWVMIFIN